MAPIIETFNLTKKFGNFTAVDSLNLKIEAGEIFGYLGANGAGKSTTIRMLCGILSPSAGSAIVNGKNLLSEPEKIKGDIGYVAQSFGLYQDLTIEENLDFYASLYNLTPEQKRTNKEKALETFKIKQRLNTFVGQLSGGLKQRVALACVLIHEPKIIFLDEPTAGVDPVLRQEIWKALNELSRQGTTLFVTTHYVEEAERCQHIAFMSQGKMIAYDTVENLKTEYGKLENVFMKMLAQ